MASREARPSTPFFSLGRQNLSATVGNGNSTSDTGFCNTIAIGEESGQSRAARRNGFRVIWIPPEWTKDENQFVVCDCGWRPDLGVHYSCGGFRKIASIDFDTDADAAAALATVMFYLERSI